VLKVALTGGIASGKTTVSDLFVELGVPVIDTDIIARQLVEPGQPALEQIVAHFGASILQADGQLDRRQLRARIFNDPGERQALEAILHPAIRNELESQLARVTAPYTILVIPLLAESSRTWGQDRTLLVDAPEALQVARLVERDHCSVAEAEAALSSQADRGQRQSIADDIILNDGDTAELAKRVRELHSAYLRTASQERQQRFT